MKYSLDGSKPIAQQSLDVQHAEAARVLMLSIIPELNQPPANTVEMRPLAPTEARPAQLTLTVGGLPPGKQLVWMGIIHANGALTPAIAYR
ncbi:MAG: hypothetical protein Q8N18_16405 [Opitutaceae bacterium]|nr:hypothetical protein [Opitutaceae bacterium]